VSRVRQRLVDRITEWARTRGADLTERRGRLARTEKRIANLVSAIADGERSTALSDALRDLEAQAQDERRHIAALEQAEQAPVALPSPDVLLRGALDLEQRLEANPAGARDELHRLFKGKKITLVLGDDGIYTAESDLLPSVLLELGTPPGKSGRGQPAVVAGARHRNFSRLGCASAA
jgi:hypothetical protein